MADDSTPAHTPPFDVPDVAEMNALLPQYEFQKLAAFGGMGAVYKAMQASLERPVAVKILPPAFGEDPAFAERFKIEARAMAKLNHTNVVAVYDFGITRAGHFYLVMEWVQGHTLHELIQKGAVPVKKVASLMMQLCDALQFAHSHQILHRDIKPGNLMVNDEERLKVADFGLARPITGEAEENPLGTPDYAAPEITSNGAVDQRADIFAAGVVLYELLTGRVPGKTRRSVTEFSPVSKRWDDIIARATDPDPSKRYPDALEFRAHIAAALTIAKTNESAPAAPAPASASTPAAAPKAKKPPMLLAGLGIAAVFVGLFLAFRPVEEEKPGKRAKKVKTTEEGPKTEVSKNTPKEPKPKKDPETAPATTPAPEPPKMAEAKPAEPAQEPKKTESAPAPAPAMAATTPPTPAPEPTVKELLAKLEADDPELLTTLVGIEAQWEASAEANPGPALQDLAGKYIPALQRSLTPTLTPDQREALLTEISTIANKQPLPTPQDTWPAVLQQLRQTYQSQAGVIQQKAAGATRTLLSASSEALTRLAQERTAKGDALGAKRAEAVAAALKKIDARPTMDAVRGAL